MAKKAAGQRYIALLRGINVGGHRVSMSRLKELFEALKLSNVSTFIASGNVIFESPAADVPALEVRIETHLQKSLGYEVDTFLRTPAELATLAALDPFSSAAATTAGHSIYLIFLREPLTVEMRRSLMSHRTPMDDFHIAGREVHWLCRGRMMGSQVPWPLVNRTILGRATVRNLTTVRKLVEKYPAG